MSEFSPTDITDVQDIQQETFLSDDEGNNVQYFAQRYMESDYQYSPECIDNAINTSRELSEKHNRCSFVKCTDTFEIRKTPIRTKSSLNFNRSFSNFYASPAAEMVYKPTDYTYARSCTYRRSSPSDSSVINPVLKRKSLHLLNRVENYFYQNQSNHDDNERSKNYGGATHFVAASRSWISRFWRWIRRRQYENNRSEKETDVIINGVPPQIRHYSVDKPVKPKRISAYMKEIFWFLWLVYTRVLSILDILLLRIKSAFISGNSSSSTPRTVVADGNQILESELATKEIKKVVTEEVIVEEYAKDQTETPPPPQQPKRSAAFFWPCFLCVLLPLFGLLLPAFFLASKNETNSTLYNYTKYFWDHFNMQNVSCKCEQPPSQPIVPLNVEKDQVMFKQLELQILALQNRIAVLEGANDGAANDLENLRKKLANLASDSKSLMDLSGKIKLQLIDFDDFRKKLNDLQTAIDGGDGERKKMQSKLLDLIDDQDKRYVELKLLKDKIESLAKSNCNCTSIIVGGSKDGLNLDDVNALITAAIAKYDADKTGLVDYALEPAGGTVISIRCTETYYPYTRKISLWSFPFGYEHFSPRTAIQPGLVPGECWPFKGSQGYLVVKLSRVIKVTAVSYEHIPITISPDGKIDSAPKKMQIYGLQSEYDPEPVFLGEFVYDDNSTALQYFPVTVSDAPPVPIIELKILSNHGNPVYTCLYRFRVHGNVVEP